ncbi:Dps family protein [Bacillus sp. 1P06AnD]|uniref:Dps family protein n=1 Tax=Bacillus sp. 1P06AnD TaxID=3132208 RepID=UPI0039A3A04E
MANKDLVQLINQEVSNFSLLFTKLHNYHWYVKGPHFFELHVKLEELYNEAATNLDELAERLLALEEQPVATMKEHLELSTLEEATGNEKTDKMIQQVINDLKKVSSELRDGIKLADEEGDPVTSDMFSNMSESLDKHCWMLRAYLD